MVVGDIITDLDTVAGLGNIIFQPAAGVEIIITGIGTNGPAADQNFMYIDAALLRTQMYNMDTSARNVNLKGGITNTIHFQRVNNNVAAREMSFTGIQTL